MRDEEMLKFEKATNQAILDLKNWVLNNKRLSNSVLAIQSGIEEPKMLGKIYEKGVSKSGLEPEENSKKFRVSHSSNMHSIINNSKVAH
jgi:hypothetical protein